MYQFIWSRIIQHLPKKLLKEEIAALPLTAFEGPIELINDVDSAIVAAQELSKEQVLGFDTETRPSFKKGENYDVSLLQLSGKDKTYLFRLNKFQMPQALVDLLATTEIIKAGVAIRDDIKGLQKLVKFQPGGFVEIADYVKEFGIEQFGLRSIAAITLGIRISNGAKLTNWENRTLKPDQLKYAATDSWVGREIYLKLKEIESSTNS